MFFKFYQCFKSPTSKQKSSWIRRTYLHRAVVCKTFKTPRKNSIYKIQKLCSSNPVGISISWRDIYFSELQNITKFIVYIAYWTLNSVLCKQNSTRSSMCTLPKEKYNTHKLWHPNFSLIIKIISIFFLYTCIEFLKTHIFARVVFTIIVFSLFRRWQYKESLSDARCTMAVTE